MDRPGKPPIRPRDTRTTAERQRSNALRELERLSKHARAIVELLCKVEVTEPRGPSLLDYDFLASVAVKSEKIARGARSLAAWAARTCPHRPYHSATDDDTPRPPRGRPSLRVVAPPVGGAEAEG